MIFCKKIIFHLHLHDINNVSHKMELLLVLITMDIYAFMQYKNHVKKVQNTLNSYSFNHAH